LQARGIEEFRMTSFYMNAPRLASREGRPRLASRKAMPVERGDARQLRVRDLMTTAVISVSPGTPVREIAATLAEHRISSVPVIDKTDRLVGIVSEGDLLRRAELATEPARTWWRSMFTDAMSTAHAYVRSHGKKARDVMTAHPVTSSPDEPLHKLAARMARKRLKRVPVVRDGRVVGLIARSDLVRKLAHEARPFASPGDDALRSQIKENIEKLPWNLQIRLVNIEVEDGVASLYGWATSAIEKRAVEVAAENVPGVVKVRNCVVPALPYV
jgi:CBS domain-containing protein